MMDESLAVVVPVYNVEAYLPQCIESVINQTYSNLEIILVDDGSEDASGRICDEYARKDDRIKVMHKRNGGLISARYEGVKLSQAQYVIFLDGDDWVAPEMYGELMGDMIGYQADLVTSGCIRYWGETSQKKAQDMYVSVGLHDRESIVRNIIPIMMRCKESHSWGLDPSACFKIFRRDLLMYQLESLKGHHFYYGEDSAIVFPYILRSQRIYCTRKIFYYHRQRAQGVLPPYFLDENYIEHLFEFYSYLKGVFIESEYKDSLIRQLDLLFMDMMKHCQEKYGITDYLEKKRYLFPFNKVKRGSKIVLYGAGAVGNAFHQQLEEAKGYEITLWVDKAYGKFGENVEAPQNICLADYDYVIIALASPVQIGEIHDELVKMGVEEEKIIYGGQPEIFFNS